MDGGGKYQARKSGNRENPVKDSHHTLTRNRFMPEILPRQGV
jgi:hypothetical protein